MSAVYSDQSGQCTQIKFRKALGFRRIAIFTNLELDLRKPEAEPDLRCRPRGIALTPGLPAVNSSMSNDWLCVPSNLKNREVHFPSPMTVRKGACAILYLVRSDELTL